MKQPDKTYPFRPHSMPYYEIAALVEELRNEIELLRGKIRDLEQSFTPVSK